MKKVIKIVSLIPAHLASIRFKKKVMHKLYGLPMIEHVRRRAIDSGEIENIIVASGDEEILDTVKNLLNDNSSQNLNKMNESYVW